MMLQAAEKLGEAMAECELGVRLRDSLTALETQSVSLAASDFGLQFHGYAQVLRLLKAGKLPAPELERGSEIVPMDDIIEAFDQASTLWEWAAARALRRIPPSPLLDSLNPYGRPLPRSMPAVTQRIPAAVIAAATRLGDGLAAARPGGDMLTGFGLDPAATKQLFDIAYEAAIGVRRNVSELALRRSLGAAVSESLVYAAVVRTMVANALQLAYQHFMRHVLPPPRDGNACFVFDDENVFRWTGYSTFVAKHVHAIVSVDF
jgi:hypothetical protein